MYLQYRNSRGTYELILANNRPDEDNEAILRGDYLDKTPTYDEEWHEIPFEMPSREELLKRCIFPDWQDGDILIIAPQPLMHPKWSEELQTLVEMSREEMCESGDLSVLGTGEKFEGGKIIKTDDPSGKYLVYSWNRNTLEWELETTKEELMLKRKDLIMRYKELKTEIETLQELEEEFESDGSIMLLKLQMQELKIDIDELLKIIKTM